MTDQRKGILGTIIYLMLGLVTFMLIGDYTVFTWADPWVYIYMAFWPAMWFWVFTVWIMLFLIACFVVFVTWEWLDGRP